MLGSPVNCPSENETVGLGVDWKPNLIYATHSALWNYFETVLHVFSHLIRIGTQLPPPQSNSRDAKDAFQQLYWA